jgi:hypothetical protein
VERSSSRRTLRYVAAVVAVVLIAGILSAIHRSGRPSAAAVTTRVGGVLVYASAGENGRTGRLWRVSLSGGPVSRGPRTLLPDQIVASGPGGRWVGVSAGGATYLFRSLRADGGAPQFISQGQLVAWAPGGNAVFVVHREPSARGRCPALLITFVDAISHGDADMYDEPSCSTADGLAIDGLTRPFVSLAGPTDPGVYELGYKQLHLVVPSYRLLSVSAVGDMVVGPRFGFPQKVGPDLVTRALLVWRGVGGPTQIGRVDANLSVERFLAWSGDGHRGAVLGTMGGIRSVWTFETGTGTGREVPARAAPAVPPDVDSVGAAFAGNTLVSAVAGHVYAASRRGYRELELPRGAPPPSGPLLWLDR